MRRKVNCRECGLVVIPDEDESLGAAVREHYRQDHPDVMQSGPTRGRMEVLSQRWIDEASEVEDAG